MPQVILLEQVCAPKTYANVRVPLNIDDDLSYQTDLPVEVGQIVKVSVRNRMYYGVVTCLTQTKAYEHLKDIVEITPYKLSHTFLKFLEFMQAYTLGSRSMIAKMAFNIKNFDQEELEPQSFTTVNFDLSEEQQKIYDEIYHYTHVQKTLPGMENANRPVVLEGVTGSGKTEVYLKLIQEVLNDCKQCLILLPEIALTQQLMERIEKYFKEKPFIWHSKTSPKQKREIWKRAATGQPCLVIGARSALFLPFTNLGIIVIDEEHDTSYKQESSVIYNARDMAILRSNIENIPILLVSATPSIETWMNIKNKKFEHVKLTSRYGGAEYPDVQVIDLCKEKNIISLPLQKKIEEKLKKGEQTLLFLNRRGYAPTLLCNQCGYKKQCPHCSISLVFHKKSYQLKCHYCGYTKDYKAENCIYCKENVLTLWGPGVEKVAEEVRVQFPTARVMLMASDTMTSPSKLEEAIDAIRNNEVDIIIGTQILAKGHHFPGLTLVAAIDADMGMFDIDLRANEKTFQLLYQVAGRAGREAKKGLVMLQTHNVKSDIIKHLKHFDQKKFIASEIEMRKNYEMPPYTQLIAIVLSGRNEKIVEHFAQSLYRARPKPESIQGAEAISILGPVPSPIYYLNGQFRQRFMLKGPKGLMQQRYVAAWLKNFFCPKNIKITIDVDPQNFL